MLTARLSTRFVADEILKLGASKINFFTNCSSKKLFKDPERWPRELVDLQVNLCAGICTKIDSEFLSYSSFQEANLVLIYAVSTACQSAYSLNLTK